MSNTKAKTSKRPIAKVPLNNSTNCRQVTIGDRCLTFSRVMRGNNIYGPITPPKPFEPDNGTRRDIAVLKLSDRNRTQPTRTNVIVSNHPKPFDNGLFNDCHARQAISPTPCQSPQNTKVHPAPCQSPQIAMLPKVAAT